MTEVDKLKEYLKGNWEKIAVQGGTIKKTSELNYLLSGLWVLVEHKWIEIVAVETTTDTFSISVGRPREIPVPEPSKINSPPRKIIAQFPSDCRLDTLGNIIEVFVNTTILINDDVLCGEQLSVLGENGKILEIMASKHVPGCIELLMQ